MQIVSLGDNLHEMPKPIFWEKMRNIISLSLAELAKRAIMVNLSVARICISLARV